MPKKPTRNLSELDKRVIEHIRRFGPVGSAGIAEGLRIRPGTARDIVWKLHVRGDVTREKVYGKFLYKLKGD